MSFLHCGAFAIPMACSHCVCSHSCCDGGGGDCDDIGGGGGDGGCNDLNDYDSPKKV